jgi:hypothetical protein
MSGDGTISARLPRQLLQALEDKAAEQHLSRSEVVARILDKLDSLSQDDLLSLPEPLRESDSPWIGFYVGWRRVDLLAAATSGSTLRTSSIVRRLLYGFLVAGTLEFVQRDGQWRLRLISQTVRELN